MDIGWAIDKGLEVLKVSQQIYQAFNSPDSNAPQQFRDLSKEFSAFHDVFAHLLELLKEHNKPLLVAITSIEYTLNKCRLFQQKFGILSEVSTKRTIRQGIAFGFRTVQWSFLAEKLASNLRTELASHSRILSLYTETLNLRNSFEERVENYEIREQNREILRILEAQRQAQEPTEQTSLDLPEVPRHQPYSASHSTQLDLPEVPRHQPQAVVRRSSSQFADLGAAVRDLEVLERFLETEERVIADVQSPAEGSSPSKDTANFINLARHEVEVQLERISNCRKRMQNMPHRSETLVSSPTDIVLEPHSSPPDNPNSEHDQQDTDSSMTRYRSRSQFRDGCRNDAMAQQKELATGLQISVPIEQASLGSNSRSYRASATRRSTTLPNDSSITLCRYLARFEVELEELDQYDVDGQISRTRDELSDLVHRSFPPSPDLRLSPALTIGSTRVSPSIEGMLSSSPPSLSGMRSPSRRDTLMTTTTRRGSIAANQWKYLARDVHIEGVPYACAKCTKIENTALQIAQRPSGGLCFRLLCLGTGHKLSDGILFRHDLSSTISPYPDVYHRGAHRGRENHVRILGQPSRLEAYVSGQPVSLKVQSSAGPCYKFASPEDSQTFQEFIQRARFVKQFDVRSVNSSAHSSHPTRHVAVRIWESITSGAKLIMFHALLVDKCEPFAYIEYGSAFAPPTTSGTKVSLKLVDTIKPTSSLRRRRANSKDSGVSGLSIGSDDANMSGSVNPTAMLKIKSIEIEFQDNVERDDFLAIWRA